MKRPCLKILFLLLGASYILWQLFLLTRFPFVHSDESWLSGLSRNIWLTGDYASTEPFFDLYPRNPHAIKALFHTLQIFFMNLFGYSIFSFRLLSLMFGLLTVIWFYKLSRLIFSSQRLALGAALFLAFDIQFIYASHFARQEIILLFIFVFSLHFLFKHLSDIKLYHHFLLGTFLGLSIGFHPNSFIISLTFIFIYLFQIIVSKKLQLSGLFIFGSTIAFFAIIFTTLSFYFDPDFIQHYASYGDQFGVTNSLTSKLSSLIPFYQRLYYGVSGTYYLPQIKLQFFIFFLALLLTFLKLYYTKNKQLKENIISILLAILAINVGIVSIGRFNQTSIIFLFPLFYLLVAFTLESLEEKKTKVFIKGTITVLSITLLVSSMFNIQPYLKHSYSAYLNQIAAVIPKNAHVLANLNSDYYFENGCLYDYRNLAYLKESGLSFEDYIEKNKIDYIIYPEEMDFIFEHRPSWNSVYGNVYPYYDDLQSFLELSCEHLKTFSHPLYGIRITSYINTKDWTINIYKVKRK